ncbi:hypothetical protein FSP39_000521 [Pinctada imbricata]|uniref:Pre-rRNA-processing protein TSR2 homolog n=1 Tax=Pinctada imbricata TaxID=66713 RepID=A0AA88YJY0_PINIB|nr:hypothetical protein FSP39_000521 [Pinctada imbricata]
MVFAVEQWFKENSKLLIFHLIITEENIETYEMEDFLADVMNAEFDTMVEDDSLPQVNYSHILSDFISSTLDNLPQIATLICGFYRLYSDGKEEEIRERLQGLPRADASQSSQINTGGDEESEEEEVCIKYMYNRDENTTDTVIKLSTYYLQRS